MSLVVDGDEESARPPVDEAELLAGQADGGRVHERHHLLHVLREHAVEQALVPVLLPISASHIQNLTEQFIRLRK